MEKPPQFSTNIFNLESEQVSVIENDQDQILTLYDSWESYLHHIKESNRDWKRNSGAKESIRILSQLEELWNLSRRRISLLKNQEYEPISLIQYRMMRFIQMRKDLRNKKDSLIQSRNSIIIKHEKGQQKQKNISDYL